MSRESQYLTESHSLLDKARARSVSSAGDAEDRQDSFVLEVLRKRWWALALCCLAGGATAYFLATEFGKQTSVVRGSLMYAGLPIPPGPNVYHPPSLTTYREVLFSTPSMQRICDQHGLGMPPSRLAEMFKCKASRYSSIMELELAWADPEDGIDMVNDTMQLLIDEAVRQRKETMSQHMRHVESARLAARSDVDRATERLKSARRNRRESLQESGVVVDDSAAQAQAIALKKIAEVKAAIEELKVSRLGIEQQLAQVDEQIPSTLYEMQRAEVKARVQFVDQQASPYRKGSKKWLDLQQVRTQLSQLATEPLASRRDYVAWRQKLENAGAQLLPPANTFQNSSTIAAQTRLDLLFRQQEALQQQLLPLSNRLAMYESRLAAIGEPAADTAPSSSTAGQVPGGTGILTGVEDSFIEEERDLEAAEGRFFLLTQQLENMRLIEQCRTPEFAVHMPASMETTLVDSNKKKLFVLFFALSTALFALPVFGIEWLGTRDSPVARFANRWGLPVIAERLLSNYSLVNDRVPDWRFDEAVRMTTLRIQQCANKSGFVVLVSNLAKTPPPAKLISTIAKCLAHREERVLIVDAMCPSRRRAETLIDRRATKKADLASSPVKVLPSPDRGGEVNGKSREEAHLNSDQTQVILNEGRRYGLADYLSRECEEAADLIHPTSCPGVDQISAGDIDFPHEAMASNCITELFEHCRRTYSIILVAGPPITDRTDFQLLASRADGIMLAASREAVGEPANRAAVEDLIELQAPMLGVVG